MGEPTAALSFSELIIEVAIKLGVAHYGDNGGEIAQIPEDAHDLNECKRHVNNAVRMFLADAPPNGWRCQRPVADVILWPSVAVVAAMTATGVYEPAMDTTLIIASADAFYPSMELKSIVITDVDTLTIATYVSASQVRVSSDHHWTGSKTFSITADGDYTLPATFGGQYTGDISYDANTSTVLSIAWTSEARIRNLRENSTAETGDPHQADVRPMSSTRRRWELVVWPMPSIVRTVNFPYELYFDKLVGLTDMHPCGFAHDETIKAACFAAAEKDAEDMIGGLMQYYRQVALPNSYRIDGRQAPRNLGSMNRRRVVTPHNFRQFQRRPTITP